MHADERRRRRSRGGSGCRRSSKASPTRPRRHRRLPIALLIAAAASLCVLSALPRARAGDDDAAAGGAGDSSGGGEGGSGSGGGAPPKKMTPQEDLDPEPEKQWGTFYDPQSIFCGEYDCYKILGFDHMTWGDSPPDAKLITRSYRQLSRRWHPDKNRGKKAKDRFVKINRAYEILTDEDKRKEYDYLRDRPDEYFEKYGSNVLYKYAPKSDTLLVAVVLLVAGCAFTWFAQKSKWQSVADRLTQASVEGWGQKEGGTEESLEIRERAMEKLEEKREKERKAEEAVAAKMGTSPKKKKDRLTNKEKKQKEMDELRPFVEELVAEIKDFGSGYHQPTWRDLLVVKMMKFPVTFGRALLWQSAYWMRRFRGMPLNDDERKVLTQRAVGEVAWNAASEEDRKEMVEREVWVSSQNLEDWREWVEVRKLGPGYQKRYKRWKKSGNKMD